MIKPVLKLRNIYKNICILSFNDRITVFLFSQTIPNIYNYITGDVCYYESKLVQTKSGAVAHESDC